MRRQRRQRRQRGGRCRRRRSTGASNGAALLLLGGFAHPAAISAYLGPGGGTGNRQQIVFGGSAARARTAVVGVLAYAALVVLLRALGKRTLSKFNAFAFVVTIAIGSPLWTVLVSRLVALAQGAAVFVVLLARYFATTRMSVRAAANR